MVSYNTVDINDVGDIDYIDNINIKMKILLKPKKLKNLAQPKNCLKLV